MNKPLLALALVLLAFPVHAASTLYSSSAAVGVGTMSPQSLLHVYGGEVQIGSSGASCATAVAGAIRYSGGSVYVCDGTNWDLLGGSSGGTLPALTSAYLWVGNGSNVATAAALSGDCTLSNAGAITCTETNGVSFGTLATQYAINLSTQATGTLQAGQEPAHTGDVTNTAGSLATTVAAIQGTTVSGTTGTGNAVLSASPTLTGTVTGAASNWSGNVGIGTSTAGNPLTVNGIIQSLTGGFKFPDGTTQTTAASGTVTSIATNNGVTGGPITGSGTIGLATQSNNTVLSNISGSTAAPTGNTLSAVLDYIFGSSQGSILYRASTAWTVLTAGSNGQVLTSGGSGANLSWSTPASASVALRQVFTSSGTWTKPSGVGSYSVTHVECIGGGGGGPQGSQAP